MKAVKLLVKLALCAVVLVVVIVLALPLWIGPVATGVANSVTPGITGTEFRLDKFALNPYTGALEVGQMNLSNPTNYDEKTAVKLDSLKVTVGVTTVLSDVIHVKEVVVDGLYVYASGLTGGNFQDIAAHASGGAEKAEGAAETSQEPVPEKPAAEGEQKPAKKVVIDHLLLKNVSVKIGGMPAIPVPTIELHDLGKPKDANDEGGLTLSDLWATVLEKVMATFGAIGDGMKALGGMLGEGASKAGDAAGAAGDAVGEGAKAVGEGAKKALDSLKSLW